MKHFIYGHFIIFLVINIDLNIRLNAGVDGQMWGWQRRHCFIRVPIIGRERCIEAWAGSTKGNLNFLIGLGMYLSQT